MPNFNQEITYLILFSAVLILPKLMRRLRLPEGISCILLGLLSSYFWESFQEDQLLLLLSRLGITSLFLFAGTHRVNCEIAKYDEHVLGAW